MMLSQLSDSGLAPFLVAAFVAGVLSPVIGILVAMRRGISSSERVSTCVLFYMLTEGLVFLQLEVILLTAPLGFLVGALVATLPPPRKI
jgi:hypothetical protein